LFELDLFVRLELDLVKKIGEDILEDGNGFSISFVKVDPDLYSEAGGVVWL